MKHKPDWRNIKSGQPIPSEGYCDQPYVVITREGHWLCVMTTGKGREGDRGQHIVSTISRDKGNTWSKPIDIEPANQPESSWAMPLIVPGGRVYVFYTFNKENIRKVKCDTTIGHNVFRPDGYIERVDTLGVYAFKFSDDNGKTWSKNRYEIPVRNMKIDRENPYQGKVLFFWGVGKPIIHEDAAYFGFAKVGRFGMGFMATSQACFMKSKNILTEKDPARITWETLPDGDTGLMALLGEVADEANLTGLTDGSLYCTYRTVDGHPCHAYSRDGGHHWTGPEHMTYTPNGKKIKHPRAANFVRRFSNGKYIYWYHNWGGKDYDGRNPVWLSGGVEKDGLIHWSQPEIVLYDDQPDCRISYPDFIEDDGRYFITETQKDTARIHELPSEILENMWRQNTLAQVVTDGAILVLDEAKCVSGAKIKLPRLPNLFERHSFTVDFWVHFSDLSADQVLLDSRNDLGKGMTLTLTDRGTIKLTLNGDTSSGSWYTTGLCQCSWDCDRGLVKSGRWHHIAALVDGGCKLIVFVIDGVVCDGADHRPYGWCRFRHDLNDVNGAEDIRIAPSLNGQMKDVRIYNRNLTTSELISNFRHRK